MTTLRRQRRSLRAALLALVLSLTPAVLLWQQGHATTTEQIVVDRNSGLAIYGYDPVAYFTDSAAKVGRGNLELTYAGAAWRFGNEGNRAAFAKDPQVYMPQYGGHDPVAVASNIARAGHPEVWAIHNGRLFLFYSDDARRQFDADPAHLAQQADANWPQLRLTLAP
jgi:YHS domain-containing protein